MELKGCYTAIATPFKNGEVDFKSLENLLNFQLGSKISGVVCCGSTGEASSLKEEEYLKILKFVSHKCKNKKQVIAGFGTNSTIKTLEILEKVDEINLDALLVIVPYYNKPTQRGIFEHFKLIAEKTKHKIILYNIPSRTGINMLPETVFELSKIKNIIGIKEASGNLDQVSEIINLCNKSFCLLSGDDSLTLAMMSVGAKGVISVASNIIPDEISTICTEFEKGNFKKSQKLHHKYFKLIKNLFIETNPIPIKYLLKKLKIIESDELRLPLIRISKENAKKLDNLLKIVQETSS
ncbi:MAG: 4-hydroxy-tetrahydrodipicolinate synthase [Elusimicrobiota bacterium]